MAGLISTSPGVSLGACVEAYEAARARDGVADLARFLPPVDDPTHLEVLRELVRVDLEFGWEAGKPTPLEAYLERFPALREDEPALREIAYEEFRQRRQAGETPRLDEYVRRFGVNTADWPTSPGMGVCQLLPPELAKRLPEAASQCVEELQRADPTVAARLAEAWVTIPEVGCEFLGFHLLGQLGSGAFGRVFLARQGDLAGRLVALKVAADLAGESRTLARMQHTNIVPIYSVHRAGPFQAVCMPYFGPTTLADVLSDLRRRGALPRSGRHLVGTLLERRSTLASHLAGSSRAGEETTPPAPTELAPELSGLPSAEPHSRATLEHLGELSYVEAVLWFGARLADGLAHAHERGILHRDLKPANILLTDEGQPMLLDFNLSEDVKIRGETRARVGGTLPYMAPEHLAAFQGERVTLDAQCDLYSLGLILYELLAGQQPFELPRPRSPYYIELLREIRQRRVPSLRNLNQSVSPAADAIVRRLLDPDPGQRYPSAASLREDLERQLAHLPLRHIPEPSWRERCGKWMVRHPRLCSATALGGFAATVILALGLALAGRDHELGRRRALDTLTEFSEDLKTAQLHLYRHQPTRAERAEGTDAAHRALGRFGVLGNPQWRDRPDVRRLPEEARQQLRDGVDELRLLLQGPDEQPDRVPTEPPQSARDHYLAGHRHARAGRLRQALPLLEEATRLRPNELAPWVVLGNCLDDLGLYRDADACYSTCVALRPDLSRLWYNRGSVRLKLGQHRRAVHDLTRAVELDPDRLETYVHRGLAYRGLGQLREAEEDFTFSLAGGVPRNDLYFLRADVRRRLGDAEGARNDREEGLRHEPTDERGWTARGYARLGSDPRGALADFDAALRLNPNHREALQNKANVLAEHLGRADDAVTVLDRLVEKYPEFVPARIGRGVLLARAGRREAALADAQATLERGVEGEALYQAANIYALTSRTRPEDRIQVWPLLARALRSGFGLDVVDRDPDMEPVRQEPEFRRIVEAARQLQGKTQP